VTDYAAIFRDGGVPGPVRERALGAVRAVAEGTDDLLAVRHPLGFFCFPVERQETSGICVHVWTPHLPRGRPTTSEVHAHSWDLLSLVLFGELHNIRLVVGDVEPTHRVFEVRSGPCGDELRATDRLVGYGIAGHDVNRCGDTYSLDAGCFHRTEATQATTIAIGRERPGVQDLSLGALDGQTHRVPREWCDGEVSKMVARLVMGQLAGIEQRSH